MFHEQNIREAIKFYSQTNDCVLWKDLHSNYKMMNSQYAKLVGLRSSDASFDNLSDHTIPCDASNLAEKFINADQFVIKTAKTLSIIEFCRYMNGEWRMHYDRKSPLFNSEGEVIGVACYAMDVTDCPLMRSVLTLTSANNLRVGLQKNQQMSYQLQSTYDSFGLTPRQSETLFYMIRGKTAKEIGRCLGINYKTVEKHQEILKLKMDCTSKSQLIEKAIAGGAGLILPKSLLNIA